MKSKILSSTLIVLVVFSLNFDVAKADGAVNAVADFVDTVVDTVVDVVVVVTNVAISAAETIVAGAADLIGEHKFADILKNDRNCRFEDLGGTIPWWGACGDDGGGVSGSLIPSPIKKIEAWKVSGGSQPLCDSVALNNIDAQGHNYAVVRDGAIIKELSASQTSYIDTSLVPHTNYEYKIRIPYPAESGFQTADSAPIAAYTKCLPQCGFGVKEKNVVEFGKATLAWNCNHNDPMADRGSCKIEDNVTGKKYNISSISGTLDVPMNVSSTFVLTCDNIDGSISIPSDVEVYKPGIKEVKP